MNSEKIYQINFEKSNSKSSNLVQATTIIIIIIIIIILHKSYAPGSITKGQEDITIYRIAAQEIFTTTQERDIQHPGQQRESNSLSYPLQRD